MVRFGPSRKGTQRGCRFHHEPVQAPVFFAHRRWAQRADPPSRVQPVGGGQLPDRSTDQHLRTQDPEQSVRRQGLRQFVHTSRTGTCPTDRSASRASFASTPVRREYGDIYQQRIYRSRSQMGRATLSRPSSDRERSACTRSASTATACPSRERPLPANSTKQRSRP